MKEAPPVDWNRHCAELAVAHIKAATGRDIWKELGDCPRGWAESAALYRKHGCRTLGDLVTKTLGPPVNPKLAHRGDIAMVDGALGIVRGDLVECADRMQPIRRATQAWRIAPERTA